MTVYWMPGPVSEHASAARRKQIPFAGKEGRREEGKGKGKKRSEERKKKKKEKKKERKEKRGKDGMEEGNG